MEPNWGLYNSYYGGERPPPSSSRDSHRRSLEQGSFLPPPPPPQPGQPSGSNLTLPPVSATYSGGPGGYHGSSPSTAPMSSTSSAPTSAGLSQHLPPSMVYSNHGMSVSSQPMSAYHYPLQSSPASMSAFPPSTARPHGYSPRMSGGYPSASPGMTTLSPLSPSTHMQYQPPSSSGTSSSFPSVPPSHSKMDMSDLRKQARRTHSASGSSSWDDRKEGDDDQPWGMPQEQYKALNPKDKKQVRNRIGARRFRAKRKDYVTQLEQAKKEADQRVAHLEAELDSSRREINDLRSRLNMPPLPPPENPGLGLNVASDRRLVQSAGDPYPSRHSYSERE